LTGTFVIVMCVTPFLGQPGASRQEGVDMSQALPLNLSLAQLLPNSGSAQVLSKIPTQVIVVAAGAECHARLYIFRVFSPICSGEDHKEAMPTWRSNGRSRPDC
jgi:hypothetical protein